MKKNKNKIKKKKEMRYHGRKVREARGNGGVKVRRAPKGPSKRDREEHEATCARYEVWYRHCVRGRGRSRPHRRVRREEEEEKNRVSRICLDYNFAGEYDGEVGAWLAMVDVKSKAVWSRSVEKKGRVVKWNG